MMAMWQLARQSLKHPLEFYYDIQFVGRMKIWTALCIVSAAIATSVFSLMFTGFSFNTLRPYEISVTIQALLIIVPWLTWSITNWAVSTISDGEGKFIDILTGSAFILVPYIVITIPLTIVSNVMTHEEGSIYNAVNWLTMAWMLFMLFLQVKVVHDYETRKALGNMLISMIGMLLIWFVIIMIFGLMNQSFSFVLNLFKEINYRI